MRIAAHLCRDVLVPELTVVITDAWLGQGQHHCEWFENMEFRKWNCLSEHSTLMLAVYKTHGSGDIGTGAGSDSADCS